MNDNVLLLEKAAILHTALFILYLIVTPFNTFTYRADPDQAGLVKAAWSGSSLFACTNMIRHDPTLVDLTSNFFILSTNVKVYLSKYS